MQRSDGDLTLVTVTEDANALASKLAEMQPFDVQVFAEFHGKALLLPKVQEMLQTHHCLHGWYNLPAAHAVQIVCKAFVPLNAHKTNVDESKDAGAKDNAQPAQDLLETKRGEIQDNSEEDETQRCNKYILLGIHCWSRAQERRLV